MSKIKANRLEPRSEDGTLTIGTPNGATMFEGDVNIPEYATTEWVLDVITEDIAPELLEYQKRDEKNKANGYAGLNGNAKVPAANLDTAALEQEIDGAETKIALNDAAIKANTTEILAKVDKSGDTMNGDPDMSANRTKDLPQIPLDVAQTLRCRALRRPMPLRS